MRYVAIAALAATFWLLVATVRLVFYQPASQVALAPPPAVASASAPAFAARGIPKPYFDDYEPDDIEVRPPPRENPISKSALIGGLNGVRPLVAGCYAKYRMPGTAMVNVVIAKSGRVSSAQVTGRFAGTPTGACVEAAVKTARFPESDGFSTPYPYQLK